MSAHGAVPPALGQGLVPLERRAELLAGVLPFAVLPPEARHDLAAALSEERADPGTVLIREGDLGETAHSLMWAT